MNAFTPHAPHHRTLMMTMKMIHLLTELFILSLSKPQAIIGNQGKNRFCMCQMQSATRRTIETSKNKPAAGNSTGSKAGVTVQRPGTVAARRQQLFQER